ncbi:hypothetical protein OG320_05900 [Microbispora sp. NBC_01189]|uniref:hypothetical protein n=1 Tax=Microbispora sp. NBC_01189 TaxID=2903583 RepID=UPI002E14277E|nr:hypothetical protein OG320_05900 [Microbispora sp. NBC_01189]
MAAAVASTSRQVGQSLGVAIAGAVVAAASGARFAPAARTSRWITAAYGLLVLCLAVLTTGRWAGRTAERMAARLSEGREEALQAGNTVHFG